MLVDIYSEDSLELGKKCPPLKLNPLRSGEISCTSLVSRSSQTTLLSHAYQSHTMFLRDEHRAELFSNAVKRPIRLCHLAKGTSESTAEARFLTFMLFSCSNGTSKINHKYGNLQ